jgi:hypothetical protein
MVLLALILMAGCSHGPTECEEVLNNCADGLHECACLLEEKVIKVEERNQAIHDYLKMKQGELDAETDEVVKELRKI